MKNNLVGKRFNKLTVIEDLGTKGINHKRRYVLCQCDCGNKKIILAQSVKSGHVKSCGCLSKTSEKIGQATKTHGMSRTRIYGVWCGIKARCYNQKNYHYKWYGERNIKMCDEWKNDFVSFYNWAMMNGYKSNLTIDRINNDGNYEPNNCRWVTCKKQCNNRTTTRKVSYKGETLSVKELSEKYNLPYKTIIQRLERGRDLEGAISNV